ncbi:NADH-quinone oxidoreductase subunit NuoF [bacterium]|nr:NADH-quinone oxidoreductase subunit NuoF [bacterium]
MKTEKILTKYTHIKDYRNIETYLKYDGYKSIQKAIELGQKGVIDTLTASQLRGRGGAGFSTGMKWSFIINKPFPRYLAINADEGEPGTFKDRFIMRNSPHLLIEGIIVACLTLEIETAYIYIRGEFIEEANILEKAIEEAKSKGFVGKNIAKTGKNINIWVHRGAGAYVCGEETALINSIEGKKGQPRLKPPFPAEVGVFGKPTIVNNVETIANVPYIILNGADKFLEIGVPKNGGTRLIGISGHVNQPGIYELPMGFSFKEAIYSVAGGVLNNRKLKAVIPGGSSTPVLLPEEIENLTLDFDSIQSAGSMMGSGGVIVIAEDTCMVKTLLTLEEFYAHESCGQCTPCREGVPWIRDIIARIESGHGKERDIDKILSICDNMMGNTICALADAAAMPAKSFIQKFRNEFEDHIKMKKCPFNAKN